MINNLAKGECEELPIEIQRRILGEIFDDVHAKGWALYRYGQHDEGSCFFHSLAEILDYDQDGIANDPAVVAALSFTANSNPPVAQGAPTQEQESQAIPCKDKALTTDYMAKIGKRCTEAGR